MFYKTNNYSTQVWLATGIATSIFYCFTNFEWWDGKFEWIFIAIILITPIAMSVIIYLLTLPVLFFSKIINYFASKYLIKKTTTRVIIQITGVCIYTLIYLWLRNYLNSFLTYHPYHWEKNDLWVFIGCLIIFSLCVWNFKLDDKRPA
jgi:hypothetical protein